MQPAFLRQVVLARQSQSLFSEDWYGNEPMARAFSMWKMKPAEVRYNS